MHYFEFGNLIGQRTANRRAVFSLVSPEACCDVTEASTECNGAVAPGGVGQVLGLCNTSTSIIAFLTFLSRFHMLADCAPRPNVHTLSHGRALYCIRAHGMTRTYVAKEPYGGLGLIV